MANLDVNLRQSRVKRSQRTEVGGIGILGLFRDGHSIRVASTADRDVVAAADDADLQRSADLVKDGLVVESATLQSSSGIGLWVKKTSSRSLPEGLGRVLARVVDLATPRERAISD